MPTQKLKFPDLGRIMDETGTDKNSAGHNYAPIYAELFGPLRSTQVNFVELGIYQGASMRAWAKYFTHDRTNLIGIDVNLKEYVPVDDERVKAWEMDASSSAAVQHLQALGPLHVVMDDASHLIGDQRRTQNQLWPLIAPGGYYIVEDLHTWWWPQANPSDAPSFAHELVDNTLGRGRTRADGYDTDLARVLIYPSLMVLQKSR